MATGFAWTGAGAAATGFAGAGAAAAAGLLAFSFLPGVSPAHALG